MANHKSAKKRNRQNPIRQERNKSKKTKNRTFIKKLRASISESKKEDSQKLLVVVQKLLSKSAKTGALKKQAAARLISRLAKQVAQIA